MAPPLRHGPSLQLGREKEEQRKPLEICKQVLILTAQRSRHLCHLLLSQQTQTSEEKKAYLKCCKRFALISAIILCVLNIGAQISTSVSVDLLLFKVFFQVKPSKKKTKGNEAIFVLFLLICLLLASLADCV